MSKAGKILFFFSLLAFVLMCLARWVYGGWHPSLWIPFGLWVSMFAAASWLDRRALRDIFGRRSTKHGMNLGALVIATLVGLVCVNYLAYRYDKKLDLTYEKLNSLSELSVKTAQNLTADTEMVLIFRKDQDERDISRDVRDIVNLYRGASPRIKYAAYDALKDPVTAKKYEYTSGPFVFYAVQGARKVKITVPTEEGITRALTQLQRQTKQILYFTRGHGEPLLDDKTPGGLAAMAEDLGVNYEIKPLIMFEHKNQVPEDAAGVMIVGPNQQFLEDELNGLRDYARRGGHLLLAIDPGTRHNLANLTKTFGIEFPNDHVLDVRARNQQNATQYVLGTDFSTASEITTPFRAGSAFVLFSGASSLKKAPEAPATLTVTELVKTDRTTGSFPKLVDGMDYEMNGPHVIAMSVQGKLPSEGAKDFSAVVFANSLFMTNQLYYNNLNRDLVGNSVAWLSNVSDLISIRPKQAKGTKLELPPMSYQLLILALIGISLLLLITGGGVWWRRRAA